MTLAAFTAGCSTVGVVADGPPSVRDYFGWVRVVTQPSAPEGAPIRSYKVNASGLRFSDGFGIGYFEESRLEVPEDCRLVVVVRSKPELDHALAILTPIVKEKVCGSVQE